MKRLSVSIKSLVILFVCLGCFVACDQFEEDVMPVSFAGDFKVNPDELYVDNNKTSRVHSEANDTIASFDKITYSTPKNGTLIPNFDGVEGTMGYRPNPGFVGLDSLSYEVCSGQTCKTAKIRLFVEEPVDLNNCSTTIEPDLVTTGRNTSREIRIFVNDIICPSASGFAVYYGTPANGTLRHYSYFEGWKNEVIIYTPKRGFIGQDSFTYKVYPNGTSGNNSNEYIEQQVTITVK